MKYLFIMTINTLEKIGLEPYKRKKEGIIYKSPKGMAIVYNDGNIEGFIKNSQMNERFLTESSLRQKTLYLLLVATGISFFTTDITIVSGVSMDPTFKNHQIIIKSSAAKKIDELMLSPGTVIKFTSPEGDTSIKRIIAKPGDVLTFNRMQVRVNGKLIDRENRSAGLLPSLPYTYKTNPTRRKDIKEKYYKLTLGPHQYFVMGDNRPKSTDSRDYGPISYSDIISIIDR